LGLKINHLATLLLGDSLLWVVFWKFQKYIAKIPGANPTLVSYNASAVKICNTSSSPVRFENTLFSSMYFKKMLEPTTALGL
jgi:hypothetical protein